MVFRVDVEPLGPPRELKYHTRYEKYPAVIAQDSGATKEGDSPTNRLKATSVVNYI